MFAVGLEFLPNDYSSRLEGEWLASGIGRKGHAKADMNANITNEMKVINGLMCSLQDPADKLCVSAVLIECTEQTS